MAKIKVTFEQVELSKEELKNRIDSIFDILFEEIVKSSVRPNKNISIDRVDGGREVNEQICLS